MKTEKTDNIYFDSVAFGISKLPKGISLKELKTYLNSIGWIEKYYNHDYFHLWFFKNFYHRDLFPIFNYGNQLSIGTALNDVKHYTDNKCILTSEALEIYLDIKKIEQVRKDTKKANRLAIAAIIISILLGLIQIITN